jgi:hypothetical protein
MRNKKILSNVSLAGQGTMKSRGRKEQEVLQLANDHQPTTHRLSKADPPRRVVGRE